MDNLTVLQGWRPKNATYWFGCERSFLWYWWHHAQEKPYSRVNYSWW